MSIYPSYLLGYLLVQGDHKGPPTPLLALVLSKMICFYKTHVVHIKERKRENEIKKPDNLKRNKIHNSKTTTKMQEQIYPYYQSLFSCEYYFFTIFFQVFKGYFKQFMLIFRRFFFVNFHCFGIVIVYFIILGIFVVVKFIIMDLASFGQVFKLEYYFLLHL